MTAVPQKVLNWLFSVLTSEYHDVNRTYNDVAHALSSYNTLSPRTDVYTFENGASALLVHLSGTLPISFRGATYRFPIDVWVPHAYPQEAPLVYVTPTPDMVVRPGQHVSGEGRVYHPYLARWHEFMEKSNVVDFLSVLSGVFAKEPPLVAKQQQGQTYPRHQASRPPPIPPLPPELNGPGRTREAPQTRFPSQSGPPPPPPKTYASQEGDIQGNNESRVRNGENRDDGSAIPPPLPQKPTNHQRHLDEGLSRGEFGHPETRSLHSSRPQEPPGNYPYSQRQSSLPQTRQYDDSLGPSSPIRPMQSTQRNQSQTTGPDPSYYQQQSHQYLTQTGLPPGYLPPEQSTQSHPGQQPPNQYPPNHFGNQQSHPQPWQTGPPPGHPNAGPSTRRPQPPAPIEDLLSLPTQTSEPLPAPPIPPNPEKDSLLRTLANTLHVQRQQSASRSATTIPSLHAQQVALLGSTSSLHQELGALEFLDKQLTSNERNLADCTRAADKVMAETRDQRKPPAVDDVLVAPTVVGGQLYEVVAEERALGDALVALQRALDRGRVSADVFARQTRSLARERFLKLALERKIARGMGLALE